VTARSMRHLGGRLRRCVQVAIVLALTATCLSLATTSSPVNSPAQAADTSRFDPGNIISDTVFYDAGAMTASSIQSFLDSKGGAIRNYRMTTATRAADTRCNGYAGVADEPAASIIAKVAASCGINPRVLIVTLQKEQGLITATNPPDSRYRIAMGYGCPDTAACDTQYYGFANQLYSAAKQFKNYAANPAKYSHRAGLTNNVRFHPNTGCGSSPVYIANQATASLYNYTPYQPNGAALAAGYGTGDACSAYGNRNFWNYFNDWFGSTQSSGTAEILAAYKALGGATGTLGAAVTGYNCGTKNGGCFQHFARGSIYWSPLSGAYSVQGNLLAGWGRMGWEAGELGYPTNEGYCGLVNGGCFQEFQGGSLYWQAQSGAHFVRNQIRAKWGSLAWETGTLGYPTGNDVCILRNGGCYQPFQGGTVYYSAASGARYVTGPIQARWATLKWESGTLGYPTTDPACGLTGGGCFQQFQGGSMYHSPATGARFIRGNIRSAWGRLGWENSGLGYPITDEMCGLAGGGCFHKFSGGSIYWSPATGAYSVTGALLTGWAATGYEVGPLGYPTDEAVCGLVDGGCSQEFKGGVLLTSPTTGARYVRGAIMAAYQKTGWEGGVLGYPTTGEMCGITGGGCFQRFSGGTIYSHPTTGAHPVLGLIYDTWASMQWEYGSLGYPVSDPVGVTDGFRQQFQRGTLTSNTVTGVVTVS
jgi:uncharacterized protein with LGFP repeats